MTTQALSSTNPFDEVHAFADRVLADTSGYFVTIMAYLGDQLGLFKTMASRSPLTSAELAQKAGVQEPCANQWLHVMAKAGYLGHDPDTDRFTLPPEHAAVLADEAGPFFFGGVHQCAVGIAEPLEQLKRSFRDGSGVSQQVFGRNMWEGMERFSATWFEHFLIPVWIPAMPDVQAKLEAGCDVADVGCGHGRALIKLATAFPRSSYRGFDIHEPSIVRAIDRASDAGVDDRVMFDQLDASTGLPDTFDIVTTFDVIHSAEDPAAILMAIRKALRRGGVYVCLEINSLDEHEGNREALGSFFHNASVLYSMATSLSANGSGFGSLGIADSSVRELFKDAGFYQVRRVPVDNMLVTLYKMRT
jgi:SAM-dependent methyltransferase